MNGGITAAQTRQFITAHYVVGENEKADEMLDKMLGHLVKTGFQSCVGGGIDWNTWDGKACGYEGLSRRLLYFPSGDHAAREVAA
jgi:hypothetical protein